MSGEFGGAGVLAEEWRQLEARWRALGPELDAETRAALDARLWLPLARRMAGVIEEVAVAVAECRAARESVR